MNGKFKVWDSKEKGFTTLSGFSVRQDGILLCDDFSGESIPCDSNFIPVYSTGQTDKNGVEIYDGDIDKNIGAVSFWKGMWGFNIDQHEFLSLFEAKFKNDLEIIGNKFENPELMETG